MPLPKSGGLGPICALVSRGDEPSALASMPAVSGGCCKHCAPISAAKAAGSTCSAPSCTQGAENYGHHLCLSRSRTLEQDGWPGGCGWVPAHCAGTAWPQGHGGDTQVGLLAPAVQHQPSRCDPARWRCLLCCQRHSCGSSVMPAEERVCEAFAGSQHASCCLCSPSLQLHCPGQDPTQAVLLCGPHAWQEGFVDHGRPTSGAGQQA